MRRIAVVMACATVSLAAAASPAAEAKAKEAKGMFVRVSPRDARYFELSDGAPYVPIGLNMIAPAEGGWEQMAGWMGKLAAHRGNYIRVWLSSPFFDVEHARSGEYDADRARRIDELLATARRCGIRVKMCMEHFRRLSGTQKPWSVKGLHHVSGGGPYRDVADFLDSDRGREQFKRKIAWYAKRYGNEPAVFAWELWNEMNCVRGGDWIAWTEVMLGELHRAFPKNLAMQSMGSFDAERARGYYRRVCLLKVNDAAQIHRYLDLGAALEVCRGPVDVLAADAVREVRSYGPGKPILLAESGAVEPRHTGPFKLYAKDKAGILLHDVLFAPFFAGAAGPGHIWHWGVYVDQMDLWHHFARFAEAIKDLDPPAEGLEPVELKHDRLRVYALKGRRTFLAWCRDTRSDWRSELAEGKSPLPVRDAVLDLAAHADPLRRATARTYDPWTDRWQQAKVNGASVSLPEFTRSIVVRVQR